MAGYDYRFRYQFAGFGLVLIGFMTTTIAAAPVRAETTVDLAAAFTSEGSDNGETSIGDLLADAVRRVGHSQIALIDAELLRGTSIPKGAATGSQFLHSLTLPSDALVVLTVPGSVL